MGERVHSEEITYVLILFKPQIIVVVGVGNG